MSNYFFDAIVRTDMGKGASRRLRHEGNIPAIVYGNNKDAVSLVLNHNEVLKRFLHADIYTSIIDLVIDGKKEPVILRDVQRHPYKPIITHLDFMRVNANEAIIVDVPVELLNEEKSVGVVNGGIVTLHEATLAVSCLPKDLPSVIQVDIANLAVGEHIMISDVPAIAGVEFVNIMNEEEMNDQPVVAIVEPRVAVEADDAEEAGEEAAEEATEDKE